MNELIIIKQLPIIEENLKELSLKIDEKVENANSLVCTSETVKEVKKTRSELNNEFKELEEQRKFVKENILKPYNEFEEIYKKYVTEKYKSADISLKSKIDNVENEVKKEITLKLENYFNEYRESKGIDETYIEFDDLGINVGLGYATEKGELTKKAKEEVSKYLDNYANILTIIETMQYSDEILVEFIKCRDLAKATKEVNDRHYVLNCVKEKKETQEEQKLTDEEMLKKIDSLSAPKIANDTEIYEVFFKVRGTKNKLGELKKFLIDGGYDYE